MARPALLVAVASVVVVAVAAVARADEAGTKRTLDDADEQLKRKQWDLCRDALDAALDEMKTVSPAARAAGQKRYSAIREKCDAGEKTYKHKKTVAKVKSMVADARKAIEAKDVDGAALAVELARKEIGPLDAETRDRFDKELAAIERTVTETRVGSRFEEVEPLLARLEADLAASNGKTNAALTSRFAIVEGKLTPLPQELDRTKALRARFAKALELYEKNTREERVVVLAAALESWRTTAAALPKPAASPPQLEAWRKAPVLAEHCARPVAFLEATRAWRSSPAADEAMRKAAEEGELRALLKDLDARDAESRSELATAATTILDFYRPETPAERATAREQLGRLAQDLESLSRTGPGLEAVLARTRTLAKSFQDPEPVAATDPASAAPVGSGSSLDAARRIFKPNPAIPEWVPIALVVVAGIVCLGVIVKAIVSPPPRPNAAMTLRAGSGVPPPYVAAPPAAAPAYDAPPPAATPRDSAADTLKMASPTPGEPPPVVRAMDPLAGPAGTGKLSRAAAYFEMVTTPDATPAAGPSAAPSVASREPPAEIANLAYEATSQLARPGLVLDFSIESLRALEASLDAAWARGGAARGLLAWVPSKALERTFLRLGCYVGETLRRNFGGGWEGTGLGAPPQTTRLVLGSGRIVLPIDQAFKRVRDGSTEPLTNVLGDETPLVTRAAPAPAAYAAPAPAPRYETAEPTWGPPPVQQQQGIWRDVRQECHIRAIAFWYRFAGLLVMGLGGLGFFTADDRIKRNAALITGFFGVVGLLVGHGLWKYMTVARWIVVALTALEILLTLGSAGGMPTVFLAASAVQCIWYFAILRTLLSGSANEIFTDAYRQEVARDDGFLAVPFWSSPFFWLPLVGMFLLCGCAFWLGSFVAGMSW